MSIIISKNGANAVKVEKSEFEKEDYLQQYIYENPESIPLYEIKEDIRLLILAREFPTNSGPIDAIGVDRDGDLYIVETKLFRNADKRTVVAQALDYGAALWRHARDFNEFTAILNNSTLELIRALFQNVLP
jgi:RecB family endonuclease NucS